MGAILKYLRTISRNALKSKLDTFRRCIFHMMRVAISLSHSLTHSLYIESKFPEKLRSDSSVHITRAKFVASWDSKALILAQIGYQVPLYTTSAFLTTYLPTQQHHHNARATLREHCTEYRSSRSCEVLDFLVCYLARSRYCSRISRQGRRRCLAKGPTFLLPVS